MLTYLAEEIEPNLRLERSSFKKEAKDDKLLASCLLGVLLRELVERDVEETTYLLTGDVLRKLEVSPAALLTALKDLRKIQHEKKAICQHCGRGPEERRAA